MHLNLVVLGSNKEERGGVEEDLLPESRTWSKEEIMGAKSSRDWLSNWSLGLNREIKGNAVQTQYKPDLLVEKGKKVGTVGTSQQSKSNSRFASLTQYKVAILNKNGTNPDIMF